MKGKFLKQRKRFLRSYLLSLSILGLLLIILDNHQLSALAENKKLQKNKPNPDLVKAIKDGIPNEYIDNTQFFFAEFDLHNDRKKDAILYTISPLCGSGNCIISVLQKQGDSYKEVLSGLANEPKIALLKTKTKGWFDIATLSYNYNIRQQSWTVWKFNGKAYQTSSQKLKQTPSKMILNPKSESAINLSDF